MHDRTKHLEINIYFVRDTTLNEDLEVRYVPKAEKTTDILTKA